MSTRQEPVDSGAPEPRPRWVKVALVLVVLVVAVVIVLHLSGRSMGGHTVGLSGTPASAGAET